MYCCTVHNKTCVNSLICTIKHMWIPIYGSWEALKGEGSAWPLSRFLDTMCSFFFDCPLPTLVVAGT